MVALRSAGCPVADDGFQDYAFTLYAGHARVQVQRGAAEFDEALEAHDDPTLADLTVPPEITAFFTNTAEPEPAVASLDAARTATERVEGLSDFISTVRADAVGNAVVDTRCRSCEERYPSAHLIDMIGADDTALCPVCAFEPDVPNYRQPVVLGLAVRRSRV